MVIPKDIITDRYLTEDELRDYLTLLRDLEDSNNTDHKGLIDRFGKLLDLAMDRYLDEEQRHGEINE